MIRGGSWKHDASSLPSSYRDGINPEAELDDIGFRCVHFDSPSSNESVTPSVTPTLVSQVSAQDGMTLLYIPSGEFTMGSTLDKNEYPPHQVYLDAFWIDQTEVTNAMFKKFVTETSYRIVPTRNTGAYDPVTKDWHYIEGADWQHPHGPDSNLDGLDNHPVVLVNWNDAMAYCQWAGRNLPTEAQWEKAARGTDGRKYPWGNQIPNKTRLNYNPIDTTEVGLYPAGASPYGALDMAGNVWEWVADWYDENYYAIALDRNPIGPSTGNARVARSDAYTEYYEEYARTYDRTDFDPDFRLGDLGFRCAMSAK